MEKDEILFKINKLIEMLYVEGKIKGMEKSGEIFTGIPTEPIEKSVGSDPHPTRGIKSWTAKSFTVKIHDEDDTIEFWVDGELKNRHKSNAAAIKFEQLLMQIKDQLASWNAVDIKKEN